MSELRFLALANFREHQSTNPDSMRVSLYTFQRTSLVLGPTIPSATSSNSYVSSSLHTSLQLYFLLLRSQHRHPLLSVWIFFVILEAVFVVSCFSFLNSTCGRPSTAYLFTASQVPCHYSHWDKEWLLPSHEGISIQHFTGCNCLRVPSFPRSDIPIMGHL